MNPSEVLLLVLAGVALFVHSLQGLSKQLQRLLAERVRQTVQRWTQYRWQGFLLGGVACALLQSSSAVSAIVVGITDAGLITLPAALSMVLGANVGTTVTAWVVTLKINHLGSIFLVLGVGLTFFRGGVYLLGRALFYFGLIFFSLELISGQLKLFQDFYTEQLMAYIADAGPALTALAGALMTALVQSSSLTTGLAVLFAQYGLLDYPQAVSFVVGANVGTTTTALLASISLNTTARQAATANLLFNLVAAILFMPAVLLSQDWLVAQALEPGILLALTHLSFNLFMALLFLPFTPRIANWLRAHSHVSLLDKLP
jgi:phosphate:Na+ symporter